MKTQIGYIKIQGNKIVFVYHELKEPKKANYSARNNYYSYKKAIIKYQASRREAKVENVFSEFVIRDHDEYAGFYIIKDEELDIHIRIKHNQLCEAEIINSKAIITKII